MAGIGERIRAFKEHPDRDFRLFLIVAVLGGIAAGLYNTTFSNFLNDVYHLDAEQRGAVEIPREMPGVFIAFILAAMASLGDTRMAMAGMAAASLGVLGLGLFSPSYGSMLMWMMLYSLGTHICLPLAPNIGMSLSDPKAYGARLGRYSAYGLVATLFGYGVIWVGFRYFNMQYSSVFCLTAVFYLLAAVTYGFMRKQTPPKGSKRVRLVFRKKYMLYYALSVVNGARKQIFLTFAPWVLITAYGMEPPTFAMLGVFIALLSIGTRTMVGRAIDRLGERVVLSAEAVLLILVCLGYAFSGDFLPPVAAMVVIAACYIVDNSMSVVEMARSTYVKKIAVSPADVTPTLSAGTSLDHVVAMSIPFLGGLLWKYMGGYQYVFMAAAIIAVINLALSLRMKIEIEAEPAQEA